MSRSCPASVEAAAVRCTIGGRPGPADAPPRRSQPGPPSPSGVRQHRRRASSNTSDHPAPWRRRAPPDGVPRSGSPARPRSSSQHLIPCALPQTANPEGIGCDWRDQTSSPDIPASSIPQRESDRPIRDRLESIESDITPYGQRVCPEQPAAPATARMMAQIDDAEPVRSGSAAAAKSGSAGKLSVVVCAPSETNRLLRTPAPRRPRRAVEMQSMLRRSRTALQGNRARGRGRTCQPPKPSVRTSYVSAIPELVARVTSRTPSTATPNSAWDQRDRVSRLRPPAWPARCGR